MVAHIHDPSTQEAEAEAGGFSARDSLIQTYAHTLSRASLKYTHKHTETLFKSK